MGTRTKFQLKILTINVISGIVYFREIILESSGNLSETKLLKCRDVNDIDMQWPPRAHWGRRMSGNGYLTYGSSSGSYGSLGTLTAWKWLDVHDGYI